MPATEEITSLPTGKLTPNHAIPEDTIMNAYLQCKELQSWGGKESSIPP